MLPFSRLVEYGNTAIPNNKLLDINFKSLPVGSTTMIDYSPNPVPINIGRGAGAVVQYDSTMKSNVMVFNGSYYVTPIISKLNLTNIDFRIEITLKSNTAAVIQSVWGTGNYSDLRIPGIQCNINQYASTYYQYFLDDGVYNRVLPTATNTFEWETFIFTYRKGVDITTYRKLTDSTQSFPAYTFGAGSTLCIGGTNVGSDPYFFTGSLHSLVIYKL